MNTNPSEIGIELDGVADQLKEERGAWRSCSGCHELNEGVAQGPWSYILECNLGMGCHECGGLGAVWDNVDYSDFGRELAAPASVDRQEAPNRGSQTSLTGADGSQAPASAPETVEIKQLEWRTSNTGPDEYLVFAEVFDFRYEIEPPYTKDMKFRVRRSYDIQPFAWRVTIEEAQAAAQADFEAKIRGLLVTTDKR